MKYFSKYFTPVFVYYVAGRNVKLQLPWKQVKVKGPTLVSN